jgi:Xaa-Pro aminopeptidase
MLVKEKIEQAKGILKELNIDCWITFVRESQINGDPTLAFLIEADVTWHSAFIITASGETRAIVGRYDAQTVEELHAYDHVEGFVEGAKEPLTEYLSKIDPAQIAVNYSQDSEICDGITHGMYLTLVEYLTEIGMADRIISAEKIVSALRQRKTATELEYIKEAIRATEEIFIKVADFIKPGLTEKQIAQFMRNERIARDLEPAWEETVCPAVFTGPDTADPHYAPTDRKIEPGHVLNMDFGVKYKHYCSDLQRTFYILQKGETEAPEEVQKGFVTIIKSIELAKDVIKSGVRGLEADAAARACVVENGYTEFPHALGHQVGRFSHDGTALLGPAWEKYAGKPFELLEAGMVFTIEPRLYVEGRGTVTIEEMVAITETGSEYLSTPQKELILI